MQNQTPTRPFSMFQAMMIWAALLMSQGMIVLVSQTAVVRPLSAPDQPAPSSLGAIDPRIFIAIGVAAALLAFVIPRVLVSQMRRTGSQPDLKKVLSIWIVRWTMLEAVTLMGFVSSMLNNDPAAIYPFAGVALIGFALTFPTDQKARSVFQG